MARILCYVTTPTSWQSHLLLHVDTLSRLLYYYCVLDRSCGCETGIAGKTSLTGGIAGKTSLTGVSSVVAGGGGHVIGCRGEGVGLRGGREGGTLRYRKDRFSLLRPGEREGGRNRVRREGHRGGGRNGEGETE